MLGGMVQQEKDKVFRTDQIKAKFTWTDEQQVAFNLLKAHLTSMLVLGYVNFSCPSDLEMDGSLLGLGTILSQRDEHKNCKVTTYTSQPLSPNDQMKINYSSAKLKLLTLKKAVTEI